MTDKRLYAYRVAVEHLPEITREMNYKDDIFQCKVINIIYFKHDYSCTIIVEKDGFYPFVESQWERFYLP